MQVRVEEAPAPTIVTNNGAKIAPRHYVRCIDSADTGGVLVTGRIYEVAIEVHEAHTWRGIETGFILGHYTTPIGNGEEAFVAWPYVWNVTRFVPVTPEDLKLEANGRVTDVVGTE